MHPILYIPWLLPLLHIACKGFFSSPDPPRSIFIHFPLLAAPVQNRIRAKKGALFAKIRVAGTNFFLGVRLRLLDAKRKVWAIYLYQIVSNF